MNRLSYVMLAVAGFLFVLVIWSLLTYTGIVSPLFLPTPTQVLYSLSLLFFDENLINDVGASIVRILLGFLISVIISLPLGFAIALYRNFEAFAEPLIDFIRHIPPSAFIPLSLILFGIDQTQKVSIFVIGIAPYLTLLVADAVARVPRSYTDVFQTLGANRFQLITRVIFPYALPSIWNAMRLMLGAAWTFVVIAEIVGASSGLGHRMIEAERYLRTDQIFAVIIVIGCLGFVTDYLFKWGHTRLFPWATKSDV